MGTWLLPPTTGVTLAESSRSIDPIHLQAGGGGFLRQSDLSDRTVAYPESRAALKELPISEKPIHPGLMCMMAPLGDHFGGHAQDVEKLRSDKRYYAEAHYNLSLALLQTGRKEESNTEFEKAYQLAPHLRATGKPNTLRRHRKTSGPSAP